ncbi:MAG TPA: acyl-CoA dehydrogenase family protein [Amycolatopsis sp.]|nr:acyl-CoA dehydrogenase family protein [Amycolatopsis sp.]
MRLEPTELTPAETRLQQDVRDFLAERLPPGSPPAGLGMAARADPEFSRALGRRGWLGMALPREYGGGGRGAVERLIVVEELLAAGAPVGHHWVADRQSGPTIAANGTEEQKRYFLPRIASGELSFAIGMSEPEAGSDLASLRTRAKPVDGGWQVSGSKIWTTGADTATHILALVRTSSDRYAGLTQFVVDRHSQGLTVSPIPFIDGTRDFCELTFDNVFVPDSRRLGEVGRGWRQNTAELVLERGGVDRWMSLMPVLEHWAAHRWGRVPRWAEADLGSITARCWAFRGMSLSIARMVDAGRSPTVEAALVKEMATRFEQDCVEIVTRHFGRTPDLGSADPYESLLARAILVSPSWSIRGGTSEVLRNIIAKGLAKA